MMSSRTFSPERLFKIRRLRKARRLFKKEPLFAFHNMCIEYPDYTITEFQDDLRRRTKKKKKFSKTPLSRYGRYWRMLQLKDRYQCTKDEKLIIKAMKLQANMTKPYRLRVRLKDLCWEYQFSPLIPIGEIESLVQQFNACQTEREVETIYKTFAESSSIPY
ncbi:hypothetical protein [Taibaiella koreensis]|uniref:hypothetical protein n=1 Tax=Taibaiella koreensis TaxID=1268548 RepID=UPI000E59A538|nr:hypothetical protein [Taibaiella koreensis]